MFSIVFTRSRKHRLVHPDSITGCRIQTSRNRIRINVVEYDVSVTNHI